MKVLKRLFFLVISIAPLGAAFFVGQNAQAIEDWWTLRSYEPPAEIALLAQTSAMTETATDLFYVHDPELLSKADFQGKCTIDEETIVLGCYISDQKIYVFDVDDPRLEGIEQVTAAHEMLHVVYDRMPLSEREELHVHLQDAFLRLDDERIKENVAAYERRDPNIVLNELHSILGTEVRDLPATLEQHYSQYFTDRLEVVAYSEQYASEFVQRKDAIEAFDAELEQLNGQIVRLRSDISVTSQALDQERTLLEQLRSTPEAFNEAIVPYNNKVRAYNNDIATLTALIQEYNAVVADRNTIAVEERELFESIDTRRDTL